MKRSFDWESNSQSVIVPQLKQASFCEPQFKNRISERDYSRNGSTQRAQDIRKEIQRKTLDKLFDAQKQKGEKLDAIITSATEIEKTPPSGLRSILSYFPHSSRIPDSVNYSGIPSTNDVSQNCSMCTARITESGTVACAICCCENLCPNCSFANYQESITRYVCHKCYQ